MSDFFLETKEIEDYLEGDCYDTPESASGQCWRVTDTLVDALGCFDWLGADHANEPVKRFKEIGQYGNHFAPYHIDSDTVVDFTFRQFDAEAPYPLVCSKQEWIERLAHAWEAPSVRTIIGWVGLDYCEDNFFEDGDYDSEEDAEEAYENYLNSFEFYDFATEGKEAA